MRLSRDSSAPDGSRPPPGEPAGGPARVVVVLPPVIDVTNAERVGTRLWRTAAGSRGVRVVVADLGQTRFCDAAGIRFLLMARRRAALVGVDVRLAGVRGPVARVLELMEADQLLPRYPSVEAALAGRAAAGTG